MKDLILIGGGHSHLVALKALVQKPLKNVRITLISDQFHSSYSGMLTGLLGGWYTLSECHFDLKKICKQAGVHFVHAAVYGIDARKRKLFLSGHPHLHYDWASINVGSQPTLENVVESEKLIPLKPIRHLLNKWEYFVQEIKQSKSPSPPNVAIVGGGVSGVEMAFVIERKLLEAGKKGRVVIFQADDELLPGHGLRAQKLIAQKLSEREIQWNKSVRVTGFDGERVQFHTPRSEEFDFVFWATQASAPKWFRDCGLPTDEKGFLRVDSSLQVRGDDYLFGAGDCVAFSDSHLAKSGVYAVRQGEVLGQNLRKITEGSAPLVRYRPQKKTLALITTGTPMSAVASYGRLALEGPWMWRLKDWIDRRFMRSMEF